MKAIILAGGQGTRMGCYRNQKHKPLVPVLGAPILFHVASRFFLAGFKEIHVAAGWDFDEFAVALKKLLREVSSISGFFDEMLTKTEFVLHDTGEYTDTADRVRVVFDKLAVDEAVITYGDTITDIDCNAVINQYRGNARLEPEGYAQTCVTNPPSQYSIVYIDDHSGKVVSFSEKPQKTPLWVGCGFHILTASNLSIPGSSLEKHILPTLGNQRKLSVYKHNGAWVPLDTPKDINELENAMLVESPKIPPWLVR